MIITSLIWYVKINYWFLMSFKRGRGSSFHIYVEYIFPIIFSYHISISVQLYVKLIKEKNIMIFSRNLD